MSANASGGHLSAGGLSLVDLLSAFAYSCDLAFGLELEDGIVSCYVASRIAEEMGLSEEERSSVYYSAFLKHAGCTSYNSSLGDMFQGHDIEARRDLLIFGGGASFSNWVGWARRYLAAGRPLPVRIATALKLLTQGEAFMHEGYVASVEVCSRIMQRIGLPQSVQEAGRNLYEQWDGKGEPEGRAGKDIPIAARVVAPTYAIVPIYRAAGRDAALSVARSARGKEFDPDVVDALLRLASHDGFWEELDSERIWELVRAREPNDRLAVMDEARVEEIVLAFADFIDLKSPYTAAHCRRVGRIAEQLAVLLGCDAAEVAAIRRAGLVHDLGLVGVSSFVINKADAKLSAAEREQVRLHPYYGERILERVP